MKNQKILVSVSGGRTSWRMAKWIKDNWEKDNEIIYVFSNTGKEREETLIFNKRCEEYFNINLIWIEVKLFSEIGVGGTYKIVDFNSASRNGEPFEEMIKKHGIPNQSFPHCTRVLKAVPIRSLGVNKFGYNYFTAIGIRKDEPRRLNWQRAKEENLIYPLATDLPTTKSDINLFWSKQPFDLELKSYEGNCDLCWKKSQNKLMTLINDNIKLAEWWQEMEKKYENFTPESRSEKSKPPYRFYRNATSIEEIIEESKFPFKRAEDESQLIDKWKQMAMYDMFDSEESCSESCEVF